MTDPCLYSEMPNVAVCVRTDTGVVVSQTAKSKLVCGDHIGDLCRQCRPVSAIPCMDRIVQSAHVYQRVVLQDGCHRVTVLAEAPVLDLDLLRLLDTGGVTCREREVAELVLRRCTNTEILVTLLISKSTLKTHLNHLYQKIPFLKTYRSGE